MPMPEPTGLLWALVKPLSGWPETDEDLIRHSLAQGWRDGSTALHAASEFDPAPLEAAWRDEGGGMFRTLTAAASEKAGHTSVEMTELAGQADRLATKVAEAKESIHSLITAGEELAEGSVYAMGASAAGVAAGALTLNPVVGYGSALASGYTLGVLTTLVPRVAEEVNGVLDRTAASVAADLPAPGDGADPPPFEEELRTGRPEHGGGAFNSDPNKLDQQLTEPLYDAGAALASVFPDASLLLAHYLDGTGTLMSIDAARVIKETPEARANVAKQLDDELRQAAELAEAQNLYGQPIRFSSPWQEFNTTFLETPNWHLGIGKGHTSVSGEVTVYRSRTGGPPLVKVTYSEHVRDRYDFEEGRSDKRLEIADIPIPGTDDEFISRFHRAGTAQDYLTVGESEPRTEMRVLR
ncbi:hypothetical protein OHR68_20650 [Spirillospora sp. NBC_00431]